MNTQLSAGKAEVVITPPLGVSIAGYYHDRRADDILDDLYARALVLSQGPTSAALVVCDIIGLDQTLTAHVRQKVVQRTGIPASNVLICCTHTHTGPLTQSWPEAHMETSPAYIEVLVRKIADAIQLAARRQQPASIRVGSGRVEGIAFNRRYWMKDGTLRTNPPFLSPDIDRPVGPIDPELGILQVIDQSGAPLAMVNTFALHPDQVGGTALCADYQGVEARFLKHALGGDIAVLCPNGCCGDINHFDFSKPREGQHGYVAAERSGRALAGEAIKQLSNLEPIQMPCLRAGNRTMQAQIRVPSSDEVAWAERAIQAELHGFDSQGLDVVRAHRILGIHADGRHERPIEMSAIALGEVAFVGLPGEIFCELGLGLKARSPFAHTFVAELCNDDIGYIPTRAAYDQGGYEATSTPFAPGTGEQMIEEALALLRELKAEE